MANPEPMRERQVGSDYTHRDEAEVLLRCLHPTPTPEPTRDLKRPDCTPRPDLTRQPAIPVLRTDLEEEALRRCLHPTPTPDQPRRLRRPDCPARRPDLAQQPAFPVLRTDLDWQWLISMADRHRVLPLVQRTLTSVWAEWLPSDVLEQLQAYAVAISLRNAYMTRELLDVLAEFDRAQIAALPFKGPVLAATLYGEVGLRDFRDLDLLVQAQNVQPAVDLLVRRGYHLDPPLDARQTAFVSQLRGDQQTAYLRSRSEHHFVRPSDSMTIDLHLTFSDPYIRFPVKTSDLFARSERILLDGTPVRTLSAEDALLMLALNGAKDFWSRLQRICDVAGLLAARSGLNERRVLERARRLGALRMLRVSLLLAHDLLEAPIPPLLAQDMRQDPAAAAVAAAVRGALFRQPERHPELSLWYSRLYVRTRERLRDRLWYYAHLAFSPGVADWQFLQLPPRLSGLYYLLRPWRIAATWALPVARDAVLARVREPEENR